MAEVENTPETPQEPAGSLVEAPEVEPVPEIGSTPQTGTESVSGPSLDDLRAEVEQSATALRTSEDLRQQLNSQLDDAEARVKAAELALERVQVAHKHGLPAELVGFLHGESAEALEAEAKTLAKYATSGNLGFGVGGLDPTDNDDGGAVGRILRAQREF
ncbi:hypothetical protein ACFUCQ_00115 [Streptomyces sp. NPDC057197]|uniref:hypothetical protein n=1 Tax=Streptomyces sp. NPDC057197 TaxID=3346045 RepID=UPI003636397D